MGLERDAVTLLQQLVRHRTVNPPGNERALQQELAALLESAGFEVTLVGRLEERPNLVARLRAPAGAPDGPRLCLLSHVDTVLASPEDWSVDPWGGEERDGHVWGRGAVDMKSQTACEVAAAVDLARSGWRPARGELLVVSVVDEEVGGTEGAVWLTREHPDLVRCDELLNEGGGAVIPYDGGQLMGVCIAEKGVHRFTIETRGAAGHASMPGVGDNALPKLAPLLEALAGRPAEDLTEAPRLLLEALGAPSVDALRERDAVLAGFVEPMTGITLAPTMVSASEKINVLPARATLKVDCRTPPGMGREAAEARIREVLGHGDFDLRFDEEVVGNGSPAGTELFGAIERWAAAEAPGARVVPTMLPAYTDSRAFRDAFPGCVAYGFFPMPHTSLYEMWPRVHGADERIDVRDLGAAARAYRAIVEDRLG